MPQEQWDVVVIGAGPAGLSAALMLGRARRRVVVLDAGSPRNRFASHMHGVLGHDGRSPLELTELGRAEVARFGVEVHDGVVGQVVPDGTNGLVVEADDDAHRTRAVVVATGITDELPAIPGLAERWGSSVLHCPYCHGWEVRDRRIGILTTSPAGLHQAKLVRQWSPTVTVFTAGAGPLDAETERVLRSRGLEIVPDEVVEVLGPADEPGVLTGVRLAGGREVPLDAVFTAGRPVPHDEFLAPLDLTRVDGPQGSVLEVDATFATSHPRVWAVGNVVSPMANVPQVMAAGATAGAVVNAALVEEEFAAEAAAEA